MSTNKMVSMKILPALLFIGLCFAACSGNENQKTALQNIAGIKKYIQAVQAKDTQTMSDLLADNYVGCLREGEGIYR